jgi:hypothetical protein
MFTIVVAVMTSLLVAGYTSAGVIDPKQYSYVCLETDQDLCLGTSPGDNEPFFNPNNLFFLQVKSRSRNEEQALDYKKLRWYVNISWDFCFYYFQTQT